MTTTLDTALSPIIRPKPVWIISLFYVFSAGWTILSFVLIFYGVIPLNDAQKEYFQSQTIIDNAATLFIGTANFAGAIFLFLLKKQAFHLLASAFVVGLVLTFYQAITKNWLGAIGGPGLIGAIIGWIISIAIIVYAKRLIAQGVLR